MGIKITPAPPSLMVVLDRQPNALSEHSRRIIEECWVEQARSGRTYHRGELFAITDLQQDKSELTVYVSVSDYAHYIATIRNLLPDKDSVRVVFTSIVPTTSDGYVVLGEMNADTSSPGRVQAAGGGIDRGDLEDGFFDLVGCALRELKEELAIEECDLQDQLRPTLLNTGGSHGFVGVVFTPRLTVSAASVRDKWDAMTSRFNLDGARPELRSIVTIRRRASDLAAYLAGETRPLADYVPPLLVALANEDV